MRLTETDGLLWVIERDPGVGRDLADPLSGLTEEQRQTLAPAFHAYDNWCSSEALRQSIEETKAVGTARTRTMGRDVDYMRVSHGRASYEREVRVEVSVARKEFLALQTEAHRQLLMLFNKYRDGEIEFFDLQRATRERLKSFHERAFDLGRRASGLSLALPYSAFPMTGERNWLASVIREETKHWEHFLHELYNGQIEFTPSGAAMLPSPPMRRYFVEERIKMYVGTLESTFDSSRVLGLPSDVLLYWAGPGLRDKAICDGCKYMVERMPFPKWLMPITPRSGNTPCRLNCRHKLLVRRASLVETKQREIALPDKATMLRELGRIMERRGRRKTFHKVKR